MSVPAGFRPTPTQLGMLVRLLIGSRSGVDIRQFLLRGMLIESGERRLVTLLTTFSPTGG